MAVIAPQRPLFILLCFYTFQLLVIESIRTKRSLVQFGRTVECAVIGPTARQLYELINCHGCWCGLGGIGEPVDELDKCCHDHDKCYDALKATGQCNRFTWEVYWRQYEFDCVPLGNEDTTIDREPQCKDDSDNPCGTGLCHCDTQYAMCVQRLNITCTPFQKKTCPLERVCIESAGHNLPNVLLPENN